MVMLILFYAGQHRGKIWSKRRNLDLNQGIFSSLWLPRWRMDFYFSKIQACWCLTYNFLHIHHLLKQEVTAFRGTELTHGGGSSFVLRSQKGHRSHASLSSPFQGWRSVQTWFWAVSFILPLLLYLCKWRGGCWGEVPGAWVCRHTQSLFPQALSLLGGTCGLFPCLAFFSPPTAKAVVFCLWFCVQSPWEGLLTCQRHME